MAETKVAANQDTSEPGGVSRRSLFQILGSVPAMAAVAGGSAFAQTHHHGAGGVAPATVSGAAYQRKLFNEQQWRTASVLSDLILPADDRSASATSAGVPEFIDDWLNFRKEQDGNDDFAAQILGGFTWLDRESTKLFQKSFADAAPAQQKQIIDRIAWPERAAKEDHAWVTFFNKYRDLTVSGFFSSKIGVADLPYLGNRAVAEWKGCDPKVWAVIEDRLKNGYKGIGGEVKPWV